MHSLLKGFRLSHACFVHSISLSSAHFAQKFQTLMLAMRILLCSCLCKVHSRVSDACSQALCNLSLTFLADFTLSDSTALIRFIAFSRKLATLCISFGSKDMITVFTCLPSYRYSSFILQAYICWRHTYNGTYKERLPWTKWPLVTWSRFIRMRVFHGVKNGRLIIAVPTGNAQASQQSFFRENCLKFSTFIWR